MERKRFIVRAEGHLPLAYDERGAALLRVLEYQANGIEATLIDLDAQNREPELEQRVKSSPMRGW
jgi:hypothetical protein